MHGARVNFVVIAKFMAMIVVRGATLSTIASALNPKVLPESNEKRVKRFFGQVELGNRARLLLTEEQAHAVMLSDAEAQKLQRYEAHLERVLYRALHELEAMRERRNGAQVPLARVEVHGGEK